MGAIMQSIHIQVCLNIYVLITCTFMFQQFYTIEPSLFKTTLGVNRRIFEGRHLVQKVI